MKKLTTWLLCLSFGAALVGCNAVSDETFTKKLTGTFSLIDRHINLEIALEVGVELMLEEYLEVEEISTDIFLEYTDYYLADNTLMTMGYITMSFLEKEDSFVDEAFDMNYQYGISGTWSVENGKIVYAYNFNKLHVQYVDNDATTMIGELLAMFHEEIAESLFTGFQEYYLGLESDSPKILRINDKELALMIGEERVEFKKSGTN